MAVKIAENNFIVDGLPRLGVNLFCNGSCAMAAKKLKTGGEQKLIYERKFKAPNTESPEFLSRAKIILLKYLASKIISISIAKQISVNK